MKWHTKALIILIFLLVCAGAAAATYAILVTDFMPTAICAGEETYAVAERLKKHWCISVLNQNGELQYDTSFSADSFCRKNGLSYADDIYYFWIIGQTDLGESALTVRQISSEKLAEDDGETLLHAEVGEHLCGMRIHEETLSVIGWHNEAEQTVLSVYLAGKDAPMFSKAQAYTLPQTYLIRNAFYQADGSVVFLTASGRVYAISELEQKPALLYDGTQISAVDFCLDVEGKICLLNCDGETVRLTDSYAAGPCLKSMCSQLSYAVPGMTLSDCAEISVRNDNCAAVLFSDESGAWHAGLYRNSMLYLTDSISRFSWWTFALLFMGMAIMLSLAAYVLLFGIWYFFRKTVTMQCHVSVVCMIVAAVMMTIVTVDTYYVYMQQKEAQNWERLTIMLNNAIVYWNPEEVDDLEWLGNLDWDYDVKAAEENDFVQRLWAFSNADVSEHNICLLFVRAKEDELTAVSGTWEQVGKHPDQIYPGGTAAQLSQLAAGDEEQLSGTFQKDGVLWMYLAQPIVSAERESAGLLVMQMPLEAQSELQAFIANLLLYLAVICFLLLLLLRIRQVLRPLQIMEAQAQKFMITGNCDPIPVKGHNEITVLTQCFLHAVSKLKTSMEQRRRSAESYARFVDQRWIMLMGKENLSALHAGDYSEHRLTVLEMRLTPKSMPVQEDVQMHLYQTLYAEILPALLKNNGIPESLSPEHMRFLFPKGCFDAVCAVSVVREVAQEQQFILEAVMDYGRTIVRACGDDAHMRFCSEMQGEADCMPLLHQICREFGCQILVTGQVVQAIPDFQMIFNCRTIGFFQKQQNDAETVHFIEILSRRCTDSFERAVRLYQAGNYTEAFGMFSTVAEKNPNDRAAIRYLYLCHQALQRTGRRGLP